MIQEKIVILSERIRWCLPNGQLMVYRSSNYIVYRSGDYVIYRSGDYMVYRSVNSYLIEWSKSIFSILNLASLKYVFSFLIIISSGA